MPDIFTLLSCLIFELDNTNLKHFNCVIQGMLAMRGRVTMLVDQDGREKVKVIPPFKDFFLAQRTGLLL